MNHTINADVEEIDRLIQQLVHELVIWGRENEDGGEGGGGDT